MEESQITIRRVDGEEDLWYAERLYLSSFPEDERREVSDWLTYTWSKPEFYNNIIEHGGCKTGFISFWDFGDFIYVEHFAMDVCVRGRGLGGMAIEALRRSAGKPFTKGTVSNFAKGNMCSRHTGPAETNWR